MSENDFWGLVAVLVISFAVVSNQLREITKVLREIRGDIYLIRRRDDP